MVIFPYPSTDEVKAHHVYAGPSAIALAEGMKRASLEPAQCYFTSVVKCNSPDPRKKLTEAEHVRCRAEWLIREIKDYDPDLVIVLGQQAFNHVVLPVSPSSTYTNGRIILAASSARPPQKGRMVLGVHFHPSYYLYSGRNLDEFFGTFKKLVSDMRHQLAGERKVNTSGR